MTFMNVITAAYPAAHGEFSEDDFAAPWRASATTTRQFNTRGNGPLDVGQRASGPIFRLNQVENFTSNEG